MTTRTERKIRKAAAFEKFFKVSLPSGSAAANIH
jgi:hypothetical protein